MIDHKAYIKDAIRTESVIDSIPMSKERLSLILEMAIAASSILDLAKKEIFYGKKMDENQLTDKVQTLIDATAFEFTGDDGEDMGASSIQLTRTLHGAIGKFTEAGEILEAVHAKINGGELDVVNVAEELGDDQWYNAILCDALEIDMGGALDRNIAKLKARYPNKFTAEAALNRDLSVERAVLEGGQP